MEDGHKEAMGFIGLFILVLIALAGIVLLFNLYAQLLFWMGDHPLLPSSQWPTTQQVIK
jgi:hypothetical protein